MFGQRGQFDIEVEITKEQVTAIGQGGEAGWKAKQELETAAIAEWERLEEQGDLDTDCETHLIGIEIL